MDQAPELNATEAVLKVGLAQINNSFSGQNYLPYATGLLQAYVEQHAARPERFQFLLPLYKRIPVDAAVAQLLDADVVGFSLYVWNERLTLEIARRLKAKKPSTLIIFGGPQVPDKAEGFLRAHPFIDVVCHGEGEQTFLDLIERAHTRDFTGIQGTSFIDAEDGFISQPRSSACARSPPSRLPIWKGRSSH